MAADQRLRHVGEAGRCAFSHAGNMAPRGASVQRDVDNLLMVAATASAFFI